MPGKQLASLLVVLVWLATFVPFGNSVYKPTEGDVQVLGGEKASVGEPAEDPVPDADDED